MFSVWLRTLPSPKILVNSLMLKIIITTFRKCIFCTEEFVLPNCLSTSTESLTSDLKAAFVRFNVKDMGICCLDINALNMFKNFPFSVHCSQIPKPICIHLQCWSSTLHYLKIFQKMVGEMCLVHFTETFSFVIWGERSQKICDECWLPLRHSQ